MTDRPVGPSTLATRAGLESDPAYRAVVPPIYLSTNYGFSAFGKPGRFDYSRSNNPTRHLLGDTLAELEHGAGAVVTASGMGAVSTVLTALVPARGVIAVPHDCYGGSWRLFDALERKGLFTVITADFTRPETLAEVWDRRIDLVWLETPSNPLMRITDIRHIATRAHAAGAIVVADNTFCSPALQRPLELGADVVVHSTTKYINGHSDVVGGAAVAAEEATADQLRWWANCLGLTAGAFDSYMVLRGLRTLGPRMRSHTENAAALVGLLSSHPAVKAVYYPGLATHPGHELAARQQSGFGGMLSFEVADAAAAARVVDGLHLFSLAESLGGVESLICHPSTMTHAAMPPDVQAEAGLSPGLLRVSAGVEEAADLVADLRAGLDRALAGA